MAPTIEEDDCPVCAAAFSQITDGSEGAKESHIQICIESQLSDLPPQDASAPKPFPQARESGDAGESCPICNTSYMTEDFDGSESAREVHFNTCFESQSSSSTSAPPLGLPPSYDRAAKLDSKSGAANTAISSEKGAAARSGPAPSRSASMRIQSSVPAQIPSSGSRRFSIFGFGGKQNKEENISKADGLMRQRWGPPGSPTSEMVRRYWMATRMGQHWEYLRAQHPRQFRKYLDKGYMEPIPVRKAVVLPTTSVKDMSEYPKTRMLTLKWCRHPGSKAECWRTHILNHQPGKHQLRSDCTTCSTMGSCLTDRDIK